MVFNWKEFSRNKKEEYRKIGHIECPAFCDEKIYFNNYGFVHLMFKGRKLRTESDINRRWMLMRHVPRILQITDTIHHFETRSRDKSIADFWEIRKEIVLHNRKRVIRIVIRRLNNGVLHFFSIYD